MTRSWHIPQGNSSSKMALQDERGARCIFGGLPSICCKRRMLVLAGGSARQLNYLTISEWAAERLVFLGGRLLPLAGPLP
jgi:hypothetical protein